MRQKDKDIATGFLRQCQHSSNDAESSYFQINELVTRLCLYFYFLDYDEWDVNCTSDDFIIDHNSGTLRLGWSLAANTYRSAALRNVVSEGVHCWAFRIDKCKFWSWELIGVWKCSTKDRRTAAMTIVLDRATLTIRASLDFRQESTEWL